MAALTGASTYSQDLCRSSEQHWQWRKQPAKVATPSFLEQRVQCDTGFRIYLICADGLT